MSERDTDYINKYAAKFNLNHDDVDAASFGRNRFQSEFGNPYNYFTQVKSESVLDSKISNYAKKINKEVNLILKRIEKLGVFLNYVKEKFMLPKMIVISDSTNIILTKNVDSISITNDFSPIIMVPLIRNKLIYVLNILYGDGELSEIP